MIARENGLKKVLLLVLISICPAGVLRAQYLGYAFHADPKRGEAIYSSA
jgi:hypothetical protein